MITNVMRLHQIGGGEVLELDCAWATSDPEYIQYHDEEWGVPLWSDNRLFEMLILEGAQAGLSWITVLRRRPLYRMAFFDFDPIEVAGLDPEVVIDAPGVIRNRQKIRSAIQNARVALRIQEEQGSLAQYLWSFTNHRPQINHWQAASEVPSQNPVSHAMSRGLKSYGMSFVGPTICYAFMQAVGMVNDHLVGCARYAALGDD